MVLKLACLGWVAFVVLCLFPDRILLGDEFDVYFLGGQSNMEGFGRVSELPDSESGSVEGVYIFQSTPQPDQEAINGEGVWATLRPGHGTGFRVESQKNLYSDRFGVELSLARELRNRSPGRKIAIIKYARNGSSLAAAAAGGWGCWEANFVAKAGDFRANNQYDYFLATLNNAFLDSDIDDDGVVDRLMPAGIVWMQGESDGAGELETAQRYQENLKRLMDLIRAAMRKDDLPVVIGRISDSRQNESGKVWAHGAVVRSMQEAFVTNDPAAALVTSTDSYAYSDPWHYDSKGYLDLGKQFAIKLMELKAKSQ